MSKVADELIELEEKVKDFLLKHEIDNPFLAAELVIFVLERERQTLEKSTSIVDKVFKKWALKN